MIGIIGLLAAIAIMIIGAYKGLAALPLSLLAALVVILSNGMPVWESYASYYIWRAFSLPPSSPVLRAPPPAACG